MSDHARLPSIAESQRTPLVEQLLAQLEQLLEENRRQAEQIQQLRDEIAVLKGQKAKPRFKPSGMDTETEPGEDADGSDESDGDDDNGTKRRPRKRPGSAKRSKTHALTIHDTLEVPPPVPVPAGARFKGYRDFVVQDLRIAPHNTRYRLEVWQTPDGERLCGALPAGTSAPSCAATCSINITTAMSPSRCCTSNCASGASTSPPGRSTRCSAVPTTRFWRKKTRC
jgi:hypothetical protein